MNSTTSGPLRGLALAAALALGAGGLAACSDDDDDDTAATTTTAAEAPAPDEADGADDADDTDEAAGDVVTVTMFDYGFDLPDEVPAGTTLEVVNESGEEVHEAVVFRISDDEERDAEELLALPEEEIGALMGDGTITMVGVGFAAPNSDEGIYPLGDLVIEEPGRYILLCNIAVGADPEEWLAAAEEGAGPPEVGDGPPHHTEGMWAELTVS